LRARSAVRDRGEAGAGERGCHGVSGGAELETAGQRRIARNESDAALSRNLPFMEPGDIDRGQRGRASREQGQGQNR
jgi:hypothetical protein